MKRTLAAVAALAFSASCATHVQTAQPNVQGPVDEARLRVRANELNARCSYEPEWAFNRGATDAPPELGLALSGGGMRAASYSVGVLSALHRLGYLEHIDVISAVSGGAYAAGWYITQKAHAGASDAELFDDCTTSHKQPCTDRYQHHLADHGRLVNRRRTAFALGTDAVMFPVNLLLNGVFGWHENTTGHRRFYERALVNEFFTEPGTHRQLRYDFEDLRAASLAKRLPLLIINTTASIDDDANHYGADFRNTVFEFSPVRYGSDAFTYRNTRYPMDLPRTVSVSGAAADLSVLSSGNVQKTLLSALNLDLGYFVDNRGRRFRAVTGDDGCVRFELNRKNRNEPKFNASKWALRLVPFPIYPFLPHWAKDARGVRTYLSDGGHSENLGAFSLIRRLVHNIVIVDASGDPNFLFHDYKQLQKSVLELLNANLRVPAIEHALTLHTVAERRAYVSKEPVMSGTVSFFPYPDGGENSRVLNIVFVRLSYDADNPAAKYPPHVVQYAHEHAKKFPFQSLFDQTYSPQQYRAYRDLAESTVLRAEATLRSSITPRRPAIP